MWTNRRLWGRDRSSHWVIKPCLHGVLIMYSYQKAGARPCTDDGYTRAWSVFDYQFVDYLLSYAYPFLCGLTWTTLGRYGIVQCLIPYDDVRAFITLRRCYTLEQYPRMMMWGLTCEGFHYPMMMLHSGAATPGRCWVVQCNTPPLSCSSGNCILGLLLFVYLTITSSTVYIIVCMWFLMQLMSG